MIRTWLILSMLASLSAHAAEDPRESVPPLANESNAPTDADPYRPMAFGLIAVGLVAITAGAVGVGRLQASEEPPV